MIYQTILSQEFVSEWTKLSQVEWSRWRIIYS